MTCRLKLKTKLKNFIRRLILFRVCYINIRGFSKTSVPQAHAHVNIVFWDRTCAFLCVWGMVEWVNCHEVINFLFACTTVKISSGYMCLWHTSFRKKTGLCYLIGLQSQLYYGYLPCCAEVVSLSWFTHSVVYVRQYIFHKLIAVSLINRISRYELETAC